MYQRIPVLCGQRGTRLALALALAPPRYNSQVADDDRSPVRVALAVDRVRTPIIMRAVCTIRRREKKTQPDRLYSDDAHNFTLRLHQGLWEKHNSSSRKLYIHGLHLLPYNIPMPKFKS